MSDPVAELGALDIYLFDQLQRGRIRLADRIVDAGCGFGRNLTFFLAHGYDVSGCDPDPDAVADVRTRAASLGVDRVTERFRVEPVEASTFDAGFASVVISSAVLHFARDHAHFDAMVHGTWRLLRSGGMLFARLASSIGLEGRLQSVGAEGRYRLPDGTTRYLVDEARLVRLTEALGGQLLDPLKTTLVQDQRSMTTWVVRKN